METIETGRLLTDPREGDLLEFPLLGEALSYWRGKSDGERPPARVDLDPIEIPALLPYVNLVDVVTEGETRRYRHRLEGTVLVERFRRNSTGRWFEENHDPRVWREQRPAYDLAATSMKPNVNTVRVTSLTVAPVAYARLIMPLLCPGGLVGMLFVVFEFIDDRDRRPVLAKDGLPIHGGI